MLTAAAPAPWGRFESVATTVLGGPPTGSYTYDYLCVAANDERRAAAELRAAVTGALSDGLPIAPIVALIAASATGAPTFWIGRTHNMSLFDSDRGTLTPNLPDCRIESLCLDPSDGALFASATATIARFPPHALEVELSSDSSTWRLHVIAGTNSDRGEEAGDALSVRLICPTLAHCSADGRQLFFVECDRSRMSCVDTAARTIAHVYTDPAGGELCSAVFDPFTDPPSFVLVFSDKLVRLTLRAGATPALSPIALASEIDPCGVVLTPSGWALISCRRAQSLYAADLHSASVPGAAHVLAGRGELTRFVHFADGVGGSAQFYRLQSIALLPQKHCALAADTYNSALRAITLPPFLFTPQHADALERDDR